MAPRKTPELPLASKAETTRLRRRMVETASAIATAIVRDRGPEELLFRLSDPFWFQAFGAVLGVDGHSRAATIAVCGALKEACKRRRHDLGIVVCGGKGATSRKTPDEIHRACDRTGDPAEVLVYASRMAAKVDTAAVQDGYELYHHSFFFVPGANTWCVIQQGMNSTKRSARRYHWFSRRMNSFVCEPHAAVVCDHRPKVLNLVAGEAERHRQAITALSREHPDRILREIRMLLKRPHDSYHSLTRRNGTVPPQRLRERDYSTNVVQRMLFKTFERQAGQFEELIGEAGLSAEALRCLSLLAETIYQSPASRRDPARFTLTHGGTDGHTYSLNRKLYDAKLDRLSQAIEAARLGKPEKAAALRGLAAFTLRLSR